MGLKYTVLIDKDNIVYAISACHKVKDDEGNEAFLPSLALDEESVNLRCKLVIVDEQDLPTSEEIFDCYYDFTESEKSKKFKEHKEHKEWRVKSDIRAMRHQELFKTDYLAVATFLTDEQKKEYNSWKKQWLDAPETLKVPFAPPEWIDEILSHGRPDHKELKVQERICLQKTLSKIKTTDILREEETANE
jgi:hypothetical protein